MSGGGTEDSVLGPGEMRDCCKRLLARGLLLLLCVHTQSVDIRQYSKQVESELHEIEEAAVDDSDMVEPARV